MKTLFGCLVLLVLLAALPAKASVSYLQSSSVLRHALRHSKMQWWREI
jgi:hypothetical protein